MIFIHRGLFLHSFYKTMVLDFTSFLYIGNCETLDIESGKSYTIRRYVKQMEKRKMIFCVEDDSNIRELVVYTLNATGMNARGFGDGKRFMEALETETPELILLDIMLPGYTGLEVCQMIREFSDVPIVMLTAKGDDMDKILGLEYGADDYITKPFQYKEVLARVKSSLRRYMQLGGIHTVANQVHIGRLCFDFTSHILLADGEPVKLTSIETKIMELLMKHPGRIFSAEEIYTAVWQEPIAYNGEKTVMVHIRRIREKIEINPGEPEYLKVVWGIGYKLENK